LPSGVPATLYSITVQSPGGNLIGTSLTVGGVNNNLNPVISLNGQTGSAMATLTGTTVNLGNQTTGISAMGPGAMLTLSGVTTFDFNAGGARVGVSATAGADVVVEGGSVVTTGNVGNSKILLQANGSTSNGTPSMLSLTNTTVSLGGTGSDVGVQASSGAEVNITGGSVTLTTGNNNNTVLLANGLNSKLIVMDTTVSMTSGNNTETGVAATGGADVEISDNSVVEVNVTGPNSTGLLADASTLEATDSGVSLTATSGDNNNVGAKAINGGTVNVMGGSVSVNTDGTSDIGVLASGSGSNAMLNNTKVTVNDSGTASDTDAGILVTNSGNVSVTGGTVLVNSNSPNSNDSGVQFGGSSPFGMSGGTITMTGGTVDQVDPNQNRGQAILVTGSGSSSGTFDGTAVTSAHSVGIFATGNTTGNPTATLNFESGASLTPGDTNHLLLEVTGTALVNLNAITDVHLIGNIDATAATGVVNDAAPFPAPANVTLQFGSSLTGWINENTLTGAAGINPAEPGPLTSPFPGLPSRNVNLGVDGNSVWTMTASSTLNTLSVNSGARIIFMDPPDQPFKTLVVNRLVGDGATFTMSVDLGQIRGDLLSILQSSEGTHLVEFMNRDQSTDLPVNVALLVVQTPDGGAGFSGETDGGTYKYYLVHGDNTSVTPVRNNWYLVRGDEVTPPEITPPPPTDPNPSPSPTPSQPKPPDEFTPGEVGPPPEVVIPTPLNPIQDLTNAANAAIGSYSAIMPMFYADMGTLNERLGELRLQGQEPQQITYPPREAPGKTIVSNGKETKEVAPSPPPEVSPLSGLDFWIRAFGSGSSFYNQASRNFFQDLGGFQFGADKRFATSWGDVYLGGFLGYFRASRNFLDGGDGHTDAFSVGAYTTLVHPSGFYADLVVKHTYMWNEFQTPTIGEAVSTATANYNLPTVGASLEIGKRWDFGHFFLEPQGQIMGAWSASTSYTASNGLSVNGESQYSLRGRIGLRTGYRFNCGDRIFEPFVTVSGGNEFLGSYTVTTDQTPFNPTFSGASVEAAIGLNARLSRTLYFYGQYEYDYSDKIRTPWSVNAGFSWQW